MDMFWLFFTLCFHMDLASSDGDLGDVVFVNVLYRHGDRTPVESYPNDPYRNTSLWPVGWGELTNIGKREHYELGKWLRKRYSKLLPINYKKEDIYVQSTDVDRTLMSAYSNLAGLYEPDVTNNWNPNIKWQPIPVHTTPEALDMVLAAKKSCPKYDKYLLTLQESQTFKEINLANKDLYNYLNKYTGLNIKDVKQISDIYNTLYIENLYNFTLPPWTAKVYPQPLKKWAEFGFTIACYDQKMARLKVGPLISDMAMHMKKKIDGKLKPDRKAWMYSAHDVTVANFLNALGIFDPQCPPYRSLILVELRKKLNNYYVTIFYKNSSTTAPFFMKLANCDKLCPFNKFSELISPLVPLDWEKECKIDVLSENIYNTISKGSLLLSVMLITTFLVVIIFAAYFCKRLRSSQKDFVYQSLKLEMHS